MAKGAHQKGPNVRREPKEFEEEVIQIDRVTRVVKGGRKLRFRATVVIGNRKGRVGVGIGKSNEVTGAIQKAIAAAKKDLVNVVLDGTTIPHKIKVKFKSAMVLLMPAGPGTGIIAGGPIRKVAELAGIKDLLSKRFGTSNKVSNTKAAFIALSQMRSTPFMEKKRKLALEKKPQPQPQTQPQVKPQVKPEVKPQSK